MLLMTAQPILDRYFLTPQPVQKTRSLGILMVGDNPASHLYIRLKQAAAKRYNVQTLTKHLTETATEASILAIITEWNVSDTVDGFIVQLPLPSHFSLATTKNLLGLMKPAKDVDNLSGKSEMLSPMVQSVLALAQEYDVDLTGKKMAVIGRGLAVGQPLYDYFSSHSYEVTSIDRDTSNADYLIKSADVIFGASGTQDRIHAGNTRDNQIIFDCSGVDVAFESVKEKAGAITPSKGAVGPLTVHFLLTNVLATLEFRN